MCRPKAPREAAAWTEEDQERKPGVELYGNSWELLESSREMPVPFLGRHLGEAPGE